MFDAERLALKTKLEGDFYFFCRYAFKQMTGMKWSRNWHHEVVCEKLQAVFDGHCKRLVVNIPPRYSKTEIVVVCFMAWCLAKAPDCEFIHASYSARLAGNNTARVRDIVSAGWYQEMFPAVKLDPSTGGKDHWKTTASGVVYAAGAGGTITGFGAGKLRHEDEAYRFSGAIIVDDPHKADEANSDTMRQNIIDWYGNTMKSRVNDPQRTPIIVVMQRLHELDLAGWLLKGGSGEAWEHLCIPAVNDADEALWPAKHDRQQLQEMENSNSYVFAGQYQQRPAPLGGGIFKSKWWQYYQPGMVPKIRRIVHSWDTAFKAKDHNDPSSGTIWAECDNGYYLLDRVNERMEFPDLKRKIHVMNERYKAHAILVEDKASGQSLIQELKQTTLPVVAIRVDSDKVTRAFAVTPLVEGGKVFLPMGAPWLEAYVSQLGTFPNAEHDDDVDSTTQALSYMHLNGGKTGLLDFMRLQAEVLTQSQKDLVNA
jgi:predicted phage terminase large subunit-like protein